MENFVTVAENLDVAPALAELARQPQYWLRLNANEARTIPLVGAGNMRLLEAEMPEAWRLIDELLAIVAREHGDRGRLDHARVRLTPPGDGLAPHFDGIDGVRRRRYQLTLQSGPGVALTVGGETRCPRPGEAWQIAAHRTHSIVNRGPGDRIAILFDTRTED